MNIEKQNIDDLTLLVKLKIEKSDYETAVKKTLNDHRRKAEIKGFRPGMAPMGLIQKMYGRQVLLEEINKLMTESIENYIKEQEFDIIGDPIPSESEQKQIDWDNDTEFEFVYEMGISNPLDFTIDKNIEIPYYNITVSDKEKEQQLENICLSYGKFDNVELSADETSFTVDLNQEGENAHNVEDAYFWTKVIADEDKRKEFVGLKVGDVKEIDVKSVFTNETDLATMLYLQKEDLPELNPIFTMTVKEMKERKKAEVNQELFDIVYGEDEVKDEADFMEHIEKDIAKSYENESKYRFSIDARKTLLEKIDIQLPEDFLKRWLFVVNDGKYTIEEIEKEFDMFAESMRWQKIVNYIAKQQEIKVDVDDIQNEALMVARERFAQYGLRNLPDEQLMHYVSRMMEDRDELNRIAGAIMERKVFEYIESNVTLIERGISVDELNEIYKSEAPKQEEKEEEKETRTEEQNDNQ